MRPWCAVHTPTTHTGRNRPAAPNALTHALHTYTHKHNSTQAYTSKTSTDPFPPPFKNNTPYTPSQAPAAALTRFPERFGDSASEMKDQLSEVTSPALGAGMPNKRKSLQDRIEEAEKRAKTAAKTSRERSGNGKPSSRTRSKTRSATKDLEAPAKKQFTIVMVLKQSEFVGGATGEKVTASTHPPLSFPAPDSFSLPSACLTLSSVQRLVYEQEGPHEGLHDA